MRRFRGLLPVVIDIETAGLNPLTDALLEIAAVILDVDKGGQLYRSQTLSYHIEPFKGARIEAASLEITGIDPTNPLRFAIPETQALYRIFTLIREKLASFACYRAILVGHNAWFDLNFILAALKRHGMTDNPFHQFTTLDTASLSALIYGETVLARALRRAKISFDLRKAHSAIYDAERTADLFCLMVNKFAFTPIR